MWIPGKPLDGPWYGVAFGKSAGSPPPAPNPGEIASAQSQANAAAVQKSAEVNQINQVSPFGSQTYTGTIGQPDRTLTTSLSPQEQQVFDKQMALANTLTGNAQTAGNQVSDISKTPFSLAGATKLPTEGDLAGNLKQVQDAVYQRNTQYLDPQYAQKQHDLDVQLANQGIPQGSEAWTRAQGDLARERQAAYSDARDASIQAGNAAQTQEFGIGQATRQQDISDLTLQRTQPMNELAAYLQGSPALQNPNFAAPAQYGVNPADVTGAYGLSTSAQQAAYQARTQQALGGNSSLAGLGSTAILSGAMMY